MRRLASLVAAALFASSGAKADPALDSAVGAFVLCSRNAAVRLEPPGDPPQDVARGAVILCGPAELKAANLALRVQQPGMDPTKIREDALFLAAGRAVVARLCRRTKDCITGAYPAPP